MIMLQKATEYFGAFGDVLSWTSFSFDTLVRAFWDVLIHEGYIRFFIWIEVVERYMVFTSCL